jgi:hypothetical protein
VSKGRIRSQLPADLKAIYTAHHDVQENQPWSFFLGQHDPGATINRYDHPIAAVFQRRSADAED